MTCSPVIKDGPLRWLLSNSNHQLSPVCFVVVVVNVVVVVLIVVALHKELVVVDKSSSDIH